MGRIEATKSAVESFINDVTSGLANRCKGDHEVTLYGVILTGSMASYMKDRNSFHHPSWNGIPDVNLYAFVDNERPLQARANMYLAESIKEAADGLHQASKARIIIDLHPSTIFTQIPKSRKDAVIQLTTRVMSKRYPLDFADYCWAGWASNYFTLFPEGADFFTGFDVPKPRRDIRWFRNMYLGLVSYGNQLLLSPLTDPDNLNCRTFDEGFRYMKEVAKDGVQMGVDDDMFERGQHLAVINEWRYRSQPFYQEAYGMEATEIISFLGEIDENYWDLRENQSMGIGIAEQALRLRDIVYTNGFMKRMEEALRRGTVPKDLMVAFGSMAQWY